MPLSKRTQKRTQMRTQMKPHKVGIGLIDFYAVPFYLMIITGQCRVSPNVAVTVVSKYMLRKM